MRYKKVFLDFKTTGLRYEVDEILQVSAIDQDGNVLINEYCKPKNINEWKDIEKIHNITPAMVKNKVPFETYIKVLSYILTRTEEVIIYNSEFEIGFLKKYGVEFNNNIYDLMYEFAEIYGQWNAYYDNYTWQSLDECCLYYGYSLSRAHQGLEECKATLYCYKKMKNNEERYEGTEYIGMTVKEFLDEALKKVNNKTIKLKIYPLGAKHRSYYLNDNIEKYSDIKYRELLNTKIYKVMYTTPSVYSIWVDRVIDADYDLLKKELEKYKNDKNKLRKKIKELRKIRDENYTLYTKEREKVVKLDKKISKIKAKLGLVLKEEKKIPMYNSYGFYSAEYCRSTRKPMIKPDEYKAFEETLLTEIRCKEINKPVAETEGIYAFLGGTHGYCALYYRNIKENTEDDRIIVID